MAPRTLSAAVTSTHEWFERHSGWAPPDGDSLAEWLQEGTCRAPDECEVRPAGICLHGLVSWWLILVALDRPDRPEPMDPARLVPHPERLDPARSDYVDVMDAHHAALLEGKDSYVDPVTGLLALTARTLWDRRTCCESGCRHCPWFGFE